MAQICKNCGHDIEESLGSWLHRDALALRLLCENSVKANKKIKHKQRHTEPIRFLKCGCTNPEPKEVKIEVEYNPNPNWTSWNSKEKPDIKTTIAKEVKQK